MATRYSGSLRISVIYSDRGDYRVGVTDGLNRWRGRISPAYTGFGPGVSYDSPKAYDEIASAALSFASTPDDPNDGWKSFGRKKKDRPDMSWVDEQAARGEDGNWHVGRGPQDAWGFEARAPRRASTTRKLAARAKKGRTSPNVHRDRTKPSRELSKNQRRALTYIVEHADGHTTAASLRAWDVNAAELKRWGYIAADGTGLAGFYVVTQAGLNALNGT